MKRSTVFFVLPLFVFTVSLLADDPPPMEILAGQVVDFTVPANTAHLIKTGEGTLNLLGLANLSLLEVLAGQVNVVASSNDGSLSVLANGGNVSFGASQKLGAVTISSGSQMELSPGASLVVEAASLAIDTASGSALDLQDNTVIVTYLGPSPLAEMVQWVASGLYNSPTGGFWGGPGIRSSLAAADPLTLHAVGILDNNIQGAPAYNHFPPQSANSVPMNAVILTYTWFGDADLDLSITVTDYSLIDTGYNAGLTGWVNGDFDFDGWITAGDYSLIDTTYNSIDNDSDGIPDSSDAHPQDFYNSQAPVLLPLSSANRQMAAPGSFLPAPLRVFLRKADGELLSNAPVTFSLNGSPGYLALSPGGNLRTTLTLRTDATGELPLVYYGLPSSQSVSATITVTAGSAVPVLFTAFSDTDLDGMPDVWENQYGLDKTDWLDSLADVDDDQISNLKEYENGTNPTDPFNGVAPQLDVVDGGAQIAWKLEFFHKPLRVKVSNSMGVPVKNVSVVFTASAGKFSVAKSAAPLVPVSVTVMTDAVGEAGIFFQGPDSYLTNTEITATLTYQSMATSKSFATKTLGDPSPPPGPDNTSISLIEDSKFELLWHDTSGGNAAFVIERKEGNADWVPIVELPPGTTSFVDSTVFFSAPDMHYRIYSTTH